MTRPRQSTLVATALVLVAILLGVTAVLLGLSAEPRGGKIVVTVRLWDEPIAAAYRQSFAAFTRSHPDIEVRTNLVGLFDLLRNPAHRRGWRQRGRHLLAIQRLLRRLR